MNKFATGLLAGSVVAALGVGYAMNDKKTKKQVMRQGKKIVSKAGHVVDEMTDMF